MNFPLYSFLVAGIYGLLGGAHEWAGRLLSALFSTATAALLYALARRLGADPWGARLSALFFLIFPLNIFFGRAFMPEALLVFLGTAALLCFDRWAQTQQGRDFLLAILAAALCFLVKLPALHLGFPLVALAWARWGWGFLRRPALWVYLGLVLLPAVAWYWHAHQLFLETGLTFGIWGGQGYDKWSRAILLSGDFYLEMFQRFGHRIFTPVGVVLIAVGSGLGLRLGWGGRQERVLWAWLGGLALYLFLIPQGNYELAYYQMPFIPAGAILAGRGTAWLAGWATRRRGRRLGVGLAALGVALTAAHSIWAAVPYYRPSNNLYRYYSACHSAGQILDQKLPAGALLVVGDIDENAGAPNRAQSPTLLYYCHRKGWQITPEEFSGATLDSLAAQGASYFVAAGGFVAAEPSFWQELLRRGVTIPAAYPRFWNDEGEFRRMLGGYRGPDRDFVVAELGR